MAGEQTARYACIQIEAFHVDRAMQKLVAAGIALYQIQRTSHLVVQAKIAQQHVKKAADVLQGHGHIKVLKASLLKQTTNFLRKHLILAIGAVVLLLAVFYASKCCLFVEVTGTQNVSEYALYQYALENGANRYSLQSKTDLAALKMSIWRAFPELSYVHVDFEGVTLHIDVREHIKGPNIADTTPSNIYATQDGVISEITVRSGRALVAVGDRVKKGDLLITGYYQVGENVFSVPAVGIVKAQTEYVKTVVVEDDCSVLEKTGNVHIARYMRLGNREILLTEANPYETYIKETHNTALMGENMPISFEIWEVSYFEAKRVASEEREALVILQATEQAYMQVYAELPADVDVRGFATHKNKTQETMELTLTVTVQKSIAERGEIGELPVIFE